MKYEIDWTDSFTPADREIFDIVIDQIVAGYTFDACNDETFTAKNAQQLHDLYDQKLINTYGDLKPFISIVLAGLWDMMKVHQAMLCDLDTADRLNMFSRKELQDKRRLITYRYNMARDIHVDIQRRVREDEQTQS